MLGVLALALVLDEQSYREAERYCSEYPAQCDAGESGAVITSPPPAESQPVTSQPQWWERSDLDAQRKMARWTTVIGILTGGGIILLGWTLWETRRVTVETQRIGKAQTRAYLSARESEFRFKNGSNEIIFWLELFNSGNSPAHTVRIKNVKIGLGPRAIYEPQFTNLEDFVFHEIPAQTEATKEGRIRFDYTARNATALSEGDIYLFVRGTVSFFDVFDDENTTEIAVSGRTKNEADADFIFRGKLKRVNPDVWDHVAQ